ncbi:RipA family octameric membrane protein [Comamonas composti]|uniref:RipA family octameric membrane protein n=1 Tax=Comamonas composti TaxID=408558 RepID=UPI0012EC0C08|nr:hypothetical protein [Comamonas composti]
MISFIKKILSNKQEYNDAEALKRIYEIAIETRNLEINQLLQRNNFFMIFQGVFFAGTIQSSHHYIFLSLILSAAGIAISWYQTKMASGAKFWQEYWEEELTKIEASLLEELEKNHPNRKKFPRLFHKDLQQQLEQVKNRISNKKTCLSIHYSLILKKYSVSSTPISLGITFTISWIMIFLFFLNKNFNFIEKIINCMQIK